MKKFNKIIAMLLCMAMLFSMCSLMGYAFEDEEEFNIEDYTWDDIMTMSNSDFRELLTNFERVYDPFGTYETDPITAIYDENNNSNTVQPRWTSGNAEHTESGSHELITARACGILLDDKGFWGGNENGSIVIALMISLASIIPDTDSDLGLGQLFEGHFYDPYDGDSWTNSTTNTAKTNAKENYLDALGEYAEYGISEAFVEYVGKMLHYAQDICVPHHADNVTFLNPSHNAFESYADENLNSYIDSLTTLNSSLYISNVDKDMDDIIHEAAVKANGDISLVNNTLNRSHWNEVANRTTREAVTISAIILYKLSVKGNIPLTK